MDINSRSALKISLIYLIFSAIWIFASDTLLLLIGSDIGEFVYISVIKGTLFIFLSTIIIFVLVKHEADMIIAANNNIENLSSHDIKTGLYNREAYLLHIAETDQNNENICVIVIDINGLKVINEIYSYEVGDEVLRFIADLLRDNFDDYGNIYRLGSDEFVVILHDYDVSTIDNTVKELKKTILEQTQIEPVFTISLGYSVASTSNSKIKEIYAIAFDGMLKNKLVEVDSSQSSIVSSLKATLFERSDETEEHANRLGIFATEIGKQLGLSYAQNSDLKLLGQLHDIGKVGVPDAILFKPSRLTEIEMNRMKQHPVIGYRIASGIQQLENVAYNIMTHHERWDGKGYPKGLKETEIPLLSRIISVVDAYDAMTNDRCYRKALPAEKALEELRTNAGTQFDPEIVNTFLQILETINLKT